MPKANHVLQNEASVQSPVSLFHFLYDHILITDHTSLSSLHISSFCYMKVCNLLQKLFLKQHLMFIACYD